MLSNVFIYTSLILQVYSFICFLRIILTWIPQFRYSTAERILSSLCDPFLNIFRGLRFLTFAGLDFSAAFGLCVLYAASVVLNSIGQSGTFSVSGIIIILFMLFWSFVSSIMKFFIVVLIVRLVVFLFQQHRKSYGSYNPVWDTIDRIITPLIYRIPVIFSKTMISFTRAIIITIIALVIFVISGDFAAEYICKAISYLPL